MQNVQKTAKVTPTLGTYAHRDWKKASRRKVRKSKIYIGVQARILMRREKLWMSMLLHSTKVDETVSEKVRQRFPRILRRNKFGKSVFLEHLKNSSKRLFWRHQKRDQKKEVPDILSHRPKRKRDTKTRGWQDLDPAQNEQNLNYLKSSSDSNSPFSNVFLFLEPDSAPGSSHDEEWLFWWHKRICLA